MNCQKMAILTLPEEKKNNMENMTEKDLAVKMANRALEVPYADPDSDICTISRQFLRLMEVTASGSVAAPKERVCPRCGSDKVIIFTSDDDICQTCGATFPGVLNGSSELASLRYQLKELEEALKELLPVAQEVTSALINAGLFKRSHEQVTPIIKEYQAIIERASKLLSK